MGRIAESIGSYKAAIREEPDDPLARFNLAVIYRTKDG